MSIASLGGRFNSGYLSLPQTPVSKGIERYVNGGMVTGGGFGGAETGGGFGGEADLNMMSDQEIMNAMQEGIIDPRVGQQVLMARAAGRQEKSTAMQLPTAPPLEAVRGEGPKTADLLKGWFTPSQTDPYAEQFESANNKRAPQTTDEANAQYAGRTLDPYSGIRKAWDWATTQPDTYKREQATAAAAGAQGDPNNLTPAFPPGQPDVYPSVSSDSTGGISALPAPPTGVATEQPGGIVPTDPSVYSQPQGPSPIPYPADPGGRDMAGSGSVDGVQDPSSPPGFRPGWQDPMPAPAQAGGVADLPAGNPVAAGMRPAAPAAPAAAEDGGFYGGDNGRLWEALTMMGFGMMAGNSPHALQNIGTAGMSTAQYLSGRRKEDRDEQRLKREDRRLDMSERRADAQLAQGERRLDIEERSGGERAKYYDMMAKKTEVEIKRLEEGGGDPANIKEMKFQQDLLDRAAKGDESSQRMVEFQRKAQETKIDSELMRAATTMAADITFEVPGIKNPTPSQKLEYAIGVVKQQYQTLRGGVSPSGSTAAPTGGTTVRKYNPATGRIE